MLDNENENGGESKEDLAEARQEGRDEAGSGSEGASVHGVFDSAEIKNARESGFNEQRVADEAGKSDNDD